MTRIKICGLFRECDIDAVNACRPDWCGFIINFPRSHRNLSPDQARALCARLDQEITPVGVFVDQPVEDVAALLNDGTISVAQLHGREDDGYIRRLRALSPGCVIWKAFKLHKSADLDAANACSADLLVLDNGYGTGAAFDWSLADDIFRPYLLAGGLTPENIPDAIHRLHPWGLDISSGVETDKLKDSKKIKAAILAARKE